MMTHDEGIGSGEGRSRAAGSGPGAGSAMRVEEREDSAAPGAPAAGAEGLSELTESAIEMLRRAGEAEALASAGFDDLLRAATRQCRRLVGSRIARIWVVRRVGRRLVAFDYPDDDEARVPVELRRGGADGPAGWAITRREPLHLGPGDPRPAFTGAADPFESIIVIPLYRRGQVFAAIECVDKRDGGPFTDEDYDRLEAASEQIALAMDNAMLHQATERRALEKDVLLGVSRMLAAPHDLDDVTEAMLKALRHVVSYDAAAIYLVNPRTHRLEMVAEIGHPDMTADAFRLQIGQGIVGWVAKTGEPLIVPDVRADSRYVVARPSTRSELAAPLQLEGRTIGVFNIESELEDAYHEGHLAIVSGFAAQAAVAVQRAQLARERLERRRMEKELAIAREIQLSFLPKSSPEIPGFDLAGTALPHAEVGGDYYDFINVSQNRLGLAMADVSGKGVPAALIMAGFRMGLLAEIRNEFAIRAVMRKVNAILHESTERHKFVTAFYGVLDYRNRVLIFSNAGHNPPILLRADGSVEYLMEGGVALGVLPDAFYEERPVAIRAGDVLLLYTDGVSEAESEKDINDQFGRERIEESLRRRMSHSAQVMVDGLVEDVRAFAGERGQTDDLTLMVVKAL
jgi:serine phosphatase RsbU (regulator of sigma subunit)